VNKTAENSVLQLPNIELLKQIGKMADDSRLRVYLVGGAVRDCILDIPNFDVDIVVEGDGIKFAKLLKKNLNAESFVAWDKFGTAELVIDDIKLEVATARSEKYKKNSRKPTIEPASIDMDLKRRDFTINTLAISLNNETFGDLTDPFNGREDISKKNDKDTFAT